MSSAGVRVDATSVMCPSDVPSSATVDYNTLMNSNIGIFVGGEELGDKSTLTAHFNRIVGNEVTAGILGTNFTVKHNAQYNWWGCNAGAGNVGCDDAVGNIDTTNPLTLSLSASQASIFRGEQTEVTASIKNGENEYAPDGTPVTFSTDLGSVTSSAMLSGGDAQATFSAGSETGTATVSASVDNQTVPVQIVVKPKQTFVYLPRIAKPITNGNFDNGLTEWEQGKGPFLVDGGFHGSVLPQSVISVNGNNVALLGDPNFTNGSIPVGYGYIAKNLNVANNFLEFEYHLVTWDIALVEIPQEPTSYYDTFEVSINQTPDQITDDQRDSTGCQAPDSAPQKVTVPSSGLAFCTGGARPAETQKDYGVKSLSLDLSAFRGQNVTIYFSLWSREYGSEYYDNNAWWNTWVTIDNVSN